MVSETFHSVKELINALYHGKHLYEMTEKWPALTPNPPQISFYYTLAKIHKPNPVGRPITSGCESATERISSFVDNLLQHIAKIQKSYLKDTTDFLNFIEKTKVTKDMILVSMDVATIAYTLTSHRRKELELHAKHTKFSAKMNLPFQLTTSGICLDFS